MALIVGGNGVNTTFSGSLSGGGSLAENGTGTLAFTGTNTLSGGIIVASGVLILSNPNALPDGSSLIVGSAVGLGSGTQGAPRLRPVPRRARVPAEGERAPVGHRTRRQQGLRAPLAVVNSADYSAAVSMRQIEVVGNATLQAIEAVIDPSNQTHSSTIVNQACSIELGILFTVQADNGGSFKSIPVSLVNNVITQVLQSNNMTVVPGSEAGSYSSGETTGSDSQDPLWFWDAILLYLQSNDVTLNG